MKNKVHIVFGFFLLFCWSGNQATAQELSFSERKEIADEAIRLLKDGTLIVRLKSKHNKITALKELLANDELENSERERIEKRIQNTLEERDSYNEALVASFEKAYSFSEVYYMYDTASTSLRSGVREGIFLAPDLEPDPGITIPDAPFFVIRIGMTSSASTTGVEALVMMDSALEDLERPFPYYVRVNSIERVFLRIFNPKKLVRRDADKVVEKLEENLRRYWTRLPKEKATQG